MEDKMQPFRQPLITATGIILGFILNFASGWVKAESLMNDSLAYVLFFSIISGIICLIAVLFRALNSAYPKEQSEAYYTLTLRLFILGICLAFAGVLLDMFANFYHE